MSTPSTKPIACQDCVRSMGGKCMAMQAWEPDCWAYTLDYQQVLRELEQAIDYTLRHRGDSDDLRKHRRAIRQRFGRDEQEES